MCLRTRFSQMCRDRVIDTSYHYDPLWSITIHDCLLAVLPWSRVKVAMGGCFTLLSPKLTSQYQGWKMGARRVLRTTSVSCSSFFRFYVLFPLRAVPKRPFLAWDWMLFSFIQLLFWSKPLRCADRNMQQDQKNTLGLFVATVIHSASLPSGIVMVGGELS